MRIDIAVCSNEHNVDRSHAPKSELFPRSSNAREHEGRQKGRLWTRCSVPVRKNVCSKTYNSCHFSVTISLMRSAADVPRSNTNYMKVLSLTSSGTGERILTSTPEARSHESEHEVDNLVTGKHGHRRLTHNHCPDTFVVVIEVCRRVAHGWYPKGD